MLLWQLEKLWNMPPEVMVMDLVQIVSAAGKIGRIFLCAKVLPLLRGHEIVNLTHSVMNVEDQIAGLFADPGLCYARIAAEMTSFQLRLSNARRSILATSKEGQDGQTNSEGRRTAKSSLNYPSN